MSLPSSLLLHLSKSTWIMLQLKGALQDSTRPILGSITKALLQVKRYKFPSPVSRILVQSIEILISPNHPVLIFPYPEFLFILELV